MILQNKIPVSELFAFWPQNNLFNLYLWQMWSKRAGGNKKPPTSGKMEIVWVVDKKIVIFLAILIFIIHAQHNHPENCQDLNDAFSSLLSVI